MHDRNVVSELKTVRVPYSCRQRGSCSERPVTSEKSAVDLNSMEAKQEGVVYRILQYHLKRTHSSQSVTVETKRCNPYWK